MAPRVEPWEDELSEIGRLSADIADRIIKRHGDRGVRAIEAVGEGRVKEYNDFIVVVGHEDEYIVEGNTCTCKDTAYNLNPEDPTDRCWHRLAAAIATAIDAVDRHELWYSDLRDLL